MKLTLPFTRKKVVRFFKNLGNSILGISYTILLPATILAAVGLLLLLALFFTRILA